VNPIADRGRVVVVAAGFGVWKDGRCLASGRWADIARVRGNRRERNGKTALAITIELRDGSELEIQGETPGWIEFLSMAHGRLPGMPAPASWIDAIEHSPSIPSDVLLFERGADRHARP
jgi:hypothetical protein